MYTYSQKNSFILTKINGSTILLIKTINVVLLALAWLNVGGQIGLSTCTLVPYPSAARYPQQQSAPEQRLSALASAAPAPLSTTHNRKHSNEHLNNIYKTLEDWTRGSMNNVTASVGRNATFECVFPDLKKDFRLAWFHKDRHTLLALHDSVVMQNGRVSVRSHANTTFYLTIHDIREEDRGHYMCQVNTIPMQSQTGFLEVNVPPGFIEKYTSSDIDVREESSVSLHCKARGSPTPAISWRREDGNSIIMHPSSNQSTLTTPTNSFPILNGEYLNITNVSRHHMGAYLCIASNGIPPTISKRIFLGITFSPLISTNKESIGVALGSSIVLECNIESYPRPTVYWQKDDQIPPIIHSDKKHEISTKESKISYRFVVRLKVFNVHKSDYGKYTCVASNMHGEVQTSIRIYEIERLVKIHRTKPKNTFLGFFTTRAPLVITKATDDSSSNKVTENFSLNQESAETEAFDYEANYINPAINTEYVKDGSNSAATRLGNNCLFLCLHNSWCTLLTLFCMTSLFVNSGSVIVAVF